MINGRVSVIIPAHNYGRFLAEAVASVRAQTYSDWELVIVDDGSSDDTPDIGARLADEDPRITFLRTENHGVAHARNTAIERSQGEFIMPLDADDILCPQALARFVGALRADPKSGYAFSNLENINILPGDTRVWLQGPFMRGCITFENTAASASLWRRSLFEHGVRYRQFIFEDWDLWLQIVAKGFRGFYIPEVLFKYRHHLSGRTAKNKYRYFPAVLELARANPTLFEASFVSKAYLCLQDAPACWDRTTVVFIPAPGSPEARAFKGPFARLAEEYVKAGNFCASIGLYPSSLECSPGLALMGIGTFSLEGVLHMIGMLGHSLLVISGLPEELNLAIKGQRNVGALYRLLPSGEHATTTSSGEAESIQLDEHIACIDGGERQSLSEAAIRMLHVATEGALKKQREDREFWPAVASLVAKVATDRAPSPLSGGALRTLKIAMVVDRDAHAGLTEDTLRESLASVRQAFPGDEIVLRLEARETSRGEWLGQLESQQGLAISRVLRSSTYARARAFNAITEELRLRGGEERILIFLPAGARVSPRLRTVIMEALQSCPEQPLFWLEGAFAMPGPVMGERDFEALRSRTFLRPEVKADALVVKDTWLAAQGSFCGELLGEGDELEELRWHAETLGIRNVWLPEALMVVPWMISRARVAESKHNDKVLTRYRQHPRHALGLIALTTERDPPHELPQPERRELEAQLFSLAPRVEDTLRSGQGDSHAQAQVLLEWAHAALSQGEFLTARRALEEADAMAPGQAEVAFGLAHVSALMGRVTMLGHYASRALDLDPHHAEAKTLLRAIEVNWFDDRGEQRD
jgi:hypothetical protein